MDGLPYDFQINLEIAVRKRVAHFVSEAQRKIIVLVGELHVVMLDVARRFADDFKVPYHRILSLVVTHESYFVHVFDIAMDALNRFKDVPEIFRQAKRV